MTTGVKRERSPAVDFANLPDPFMERLVAFQDFESNLTLRIVCTVWRNTMSPVFDRDVRWRCDNVEVLDPSVAENVRCLSIDFHQDVLHLPMYVEEVEVFNNESSIEEVAMMRFPRLEWLKKVVINGGLNYLQALNLSKLPHLEYLDLDRFSGTLQLPKAATLKTLITGDEFNQPLDLCGQTALESLEIKHDDYQHSLDLENLHALKELKVPYNFEPTLIKKGGKLCIIPLLMLPIRFPKAWNAYKIEIIECTVRFFA